MLKALKDGNLDSFKKLSSDFGWVEIREDKIREFEQETRGAEKDAFKKVFSAQRIKTVLK